MSGHPAAVYGVVRPFTTRANSLSQPVVDAIEDEISMHWITKDDMHSRSHIVLRTPYLVSYGSLVYSITDVAQGSFTMFAKTGLPRHGENN